MKRSIHIEAPVEKVFDFVKDPRNVPQGITEPYEVKDVKQTDEGVGSYYSWVFRVAGLPVEGFEVFTEFIPNQRITERSSQSFFGTFIWTFEPEGSGMKMTIESRPGSFWRFPPLRQLADLGKTMAGERWLSAVKAQMEG